MSSGPAPPWPKPRPAMLAALKHAPSRHGERDALEPFAHKRTRQIFLTQAPERALTALAVLILERLAAAGASPLPAADLQALCGKLFDGYSQEELVALEHEAYECLGWVGQALDPTLLRDPLAHTTYPKEANQTMTPTDLVGWALYRGKDLEVAYFDPNTTAITPHLITPTRVEAARYLRAISHTTMQEEVFLLDRLTQITPRGGWPVHRTEHLNPPAPPPPPAQSPPPHRSA